MLKIFFSNNLEYLSDELVKKIENNNHLDNIFKPILIIVQTEGMQKWLSLTISKKTRIFTNFKFFSPAEFIYNILKEIGIPENFYKKEILTFLISSIIDSKQFIYKEISEYLSSDNYFSKLFHISYQLADIFEQYIVFRQPMIKKWEKKEYAYKNENLEKWQRQLYLKIRKIINDSPYTLKLSNIIANNKKLHKYSPIHIFGISILPPIFVEFFKTLGKLIDINFYLLNPCKEYWFEDLPEKKILKKQEYEYLYLEEGNPLLSNLGTLGKNFFSNFIEENAFIKEEYFNLKNNTCLNVIKQDILSRNDELKKIHLHDFDSIQIHVCHSPLREIEVLYNNILQFLQKDNSLKLEDILVMAPDIDLYEPYIKSIFKDIPYNISDTNPIESSLFIKILFKILELNKTKFEASEILNILEFESIKKKFNLNESDIDFIREIITSAEIRWGLDKKFKKDFFAKEDDFLEFNTWEHGFKRILYGFMMNDEKIINNVIPITEIDSSSTQIIGNFFSFFNILTDFYNKSKEKKNISQWALIIENLINDIFNLEPEYEFYYKKVINALSYLNNKFISSNFQVSIDFVVEFLKKKISDSLSSYKFLSGGITFAEMIPMRSIPFKIIYLIGLNDDTFPRQKKQLNFDLMYHYPEPGDRNLKDNDKYLFLETIISAKEKLYISYTGFNIKDNKELPPSLLVSELLDYLDKRIEIDGKSPSKVIVYKHKLHSFNPQYFQENSSLFSFLEEDFYAADTILNKPKIIYTQNSLELDKPKEFESNISIEDLWSFYSNPVKYFFTNIIEATLSEVSEIPSDFEPISLDPLQKYKIREEIFYEFLKNKEESEIIKKILYQGILPYSKLGEIIIEDIKKDAKQMKNIIQNHLNIENSERIYIEFEFNNLIINGEIDNFNFLKNEYYYFRPARLNPKDYLKAIINHFSISIFLDKKITTYILGLNEKIKKITDIDINFFSQLINIYLESYKKMIKFEPQISFKIIDKKSNYIPTPNLIEKYADKYLRFLLNKGFIFFDEEFKRYSELIFLPVKKMLQN